MGAALCGGRHEALGARLRAADAPRLADGLGGASAVTAHAHLVLSARPPRHVADLHAAAAERGCRRLQPGRGRGLPAGAISGPRAGSHKMVVFPALSSPSTKILASLSPNSDSSLDTQRPCGRAGRSRRSAPPRSTRHCHGAAALTIEPSFPPGHPLYRCLLPSRCCRVGARS